MAASAPPRTHSGEGVAPGRKRYPRADE